MENTTKKTRKVKRQVDSVIAHIQSTFNNTIVSITTLDGDVLLRGSAGQQGFKGARKGTPFAASQIASELISGMKAMGIKSVEINTKGPGSAKDSVVRTLSAAGFEIPVLRDVTRLPHNGTRAPKKRRV